MFIPIEISARHLHLSAEHLALLFGDSYQLQILNNLSQSGEFAATDSLTLIGPRGKLRARIVGPLRHATQVELSLSDCRQLGLQAPLRLSGDLQSSGHITLAGPRGQFLLSTGLIIARRHLHLNPQTAQELNLQNNQSVSVRITGDRGGILDHIIVRIQTNFQTALHLDTDEANALGIDRDNQQAELLV
jgi:putative phosphotransacetylase